MDGECGSIDWSITFDDFSTRADTNEIRGLDESKVHPEGIDPKSLRISWIASSDMASYAFIESKA